MNAPVFAEKLGSGRWQGVKYVIDRCPSCGGVGTLGFAGNGALWGCTQCHKGGKNLASYRTHLLNNPLTAALVESIVEPVAPNDLANVARYVAPKNKSVIPTGFGAIDRLLGGLTEGAMTVITGKRGQGKSTLLSQFALNGIEKNHIVAFYSGELAISRFQAWIFSQAAGAGHMYTEPDQFGEPRWNVSEPAEKKIREWLDGKLWLYDNTHIDSSERRTILRAFNHARFYYGADLFFVDNLMTARFDIDDERDTLQAQANFAADMLDFARVNNVHVILVAHPRKGESDDICDSVAGFGTITNLATNVIQIKTADDKERSEYNCDAIIEVGKNREYGDAGRLPLKFDKPSRRFMPMTGSMIYKYGWEKQ